MTTEQTARLLESSLQAAIQIPGVPVYRASESSTRTLPCIVLACVPQGTLYEMRSPSGDYGTSADLSLTAMVSAATPESGDAIEALLAQAIIAVETAQINPTPWLIVQIDRSGGSGSEFDGVRRRKSVEWSCQLLPA